MPIHPSPRPPFGAPYAPDDRAMATHLLQEARLGAAQEGRIDRTATGLIVAIRANDDLLGGVEDMLREFALSTKEGLALMVLAEALLRVPDARTADQFIEDKLGQGDFVHHETRSSAFLVNASAWALGMSTRVIQPGETPQGTIGRLTKRLGAPAVRGAARQARPPMGHPFVAGVARPSKPRWLAPGHAHQGTSAIRSICSAKAPAPPTTPRATSIPMQVPSRRSAARPIIMRCPIGQASRSSSRPCIRASKR